MKATTQQQTIVFEAFDTFLAQAKYAQVNKAELSIRECWYMFQLFLLQKSNRTNPNWDEADRLWQFEDRPNGFGTHREWYFKGLNDTHLETVFKAYMRKQRKAA